MSQLKVLSLVVMSCVCKHTVRKSREGEGVHRPPAQTHYTKPVLNPYLQGECDNISPPTHTNTTFYQ